MYERDQLFIDGKWTSPVSKPPSGSESDAVITVVSPHSEAVIGHAACAGPADVDRAVDAARAAFDTGPWPRMQPAERIEALTRLAGIYKERRADMAALISAEIGAPISFAKRAQVALPLTMISAFCGMPQILTVTKVVPALLAGCSVVLKPAPESVLDAQLLAELVAEADLPPGVLNVVPGGREVGELLVGHPGVDKVSFTGSTAAGRQVALACAAGLKQVSLELGGKSAAIVLDDADPSSTATAIQMASLANSGQVCNALSRILVPEARKDQFVDALAAGMSSMTVGDPADPNTQIGPLVAKRQQERVRGYIEAGRSEGARLVIGGADMPDGLDTGWYVRPTLFSDASNDMRIAREEIFGPVLTVIAYGDEDEAVRIANDSEYGLAGSVFTTDVDRGYGVAARVRSGTFGVNEGYIMDPAAPFGGVKNSGYGRELGTEGIDSYTVSQSISAAAPADNRP